MEATLKIIDALKDVRQIRIEKLKKAMNCKTQKDRFAIANGSVQVLTAMSTTWIANNSKAPKLLLSRIESAPRVYDTKGVNFI